MSRAPLLHSSAACSRHARGPPYQDPPRVRRRAHNRQGSPLHSLSRNARLGISPNPNLDNQEWPQ
eukprot:1180870-Prorocentrum_minimum.AAC.3